MWFSSSLGDLDHGVSSFSLLSFLQFYYEDLCYSTFCSQLSNVMCSDRFVRYEKFIFLKIFLYIIWLDYKP